MLSFVSSFARYVLMLLIPKNKVLMPLFRRYLYIGYHIGSPEKGILSVK